MEADKKGMIYPVILSLPEKERHFSGRERVLNLSMHARRALKISAEKSGIRLSNLSKDDNGAPLPFDGNHWSLTHKREYAGGVVAPIRIGIDIEKIQSCSKALFKKTASDREWSLGDDDPFKLFFRYWTSKEAVLKATGAGFKDFSKCRIEQVTGNNHLVIDYRDKNWLIEHFFFNNHIASIVKNSFQIKWILANST